MKTLSGVFKHALCYPAVCCCLFYPAYALENTTHLPLAPNMLSAAPRQSITLLEVQQRVLVVHPDLVAAQAGVARSTALLQQARMSLNPELSSSIENARYPTREWSVGISQTLEPLAKRKAREILASRQIDLADSALVVQRQMLMMQAKQAFFTLLYEQSAFDLQLKNLAQAQYATQIAARRVQAGNLSPVEENKAKLAELEAEQDNQQAKMRIVLAQQNLAALWGETNLANYRLLYIDADWDNLPSFSNLAVLKSNLEKSPVLQQAQQQVAEKQALLQVEQVRTLPNYTFSAGLKRVADTGKTQFTLGFSMPLTWFDRNTGNIQAEFEQVKQAEAQARSSSLQQNMALEEAWTTWQATQTLLDSLQSQALPLATQNLQAAQKGFEAGKFHVLEVLDAQRSLFSLQLKCLQLKNTLQQTAIQVQFLSNTL